MTAIDGFVKGLMQDFPLTTAHIFWRAEKLFGDKKIIARLPEGLHRYTYAEFAVRVRKLAAALIEMGVKPGDRVATFGWNTHRHHELYYAVPCIGAILHTLNIRLHLDQLRYITEHAEDRIVFFDGCLSESFEALRRESSVIRTVVHMGPMEQEVAGAMDYEKLLEDADPLADWPVLREEQACGMCYTSGTTGEPKGVMYSHRSTVLHAFGIDTASGHGLREDDTTLTIVPMFHAMAWGHPYAATMAGCDQVHPGPFLDAASLLSLIESERVTICAGVPTIWASMLDELSRKSYDLSSLRCIVSGGAALAPSVLRAFEEEHRVPVVQGWGMTETSPVCAHGHLRSAYRDAPRETQLEMKSKTGFMLPGVEFRIVDDAGEELPWDGRSSGELQVRGPWIASSYYRDPRSGDSFVDGWLRTGDVAVVDPTGYFTIVDRTKDLVKSGGEWISSVELEKHIMEHPSVKEAAVIAVPHPRWTERPLACVVLKENRSLSSQELTDFLRPRVSSWWLPDEIVFIDEVPKTSVGKFDKKVLRSRFSGAPMAEHEGDASSTALE